MIRLFVYPAITLGGLIYYYGLGLSLLETLVPLGVSYVIATATIEYAFVQMVRLRKEGVHQDILHILSSALDLRDEATGGHSRRVAMLSLIIARQLHVNGERLIDLERAAILHDVGKVAIADAIPCPTSQRRSNDGWRRLRGKTVTRHNCPRSAGDDRVSLGIVACGAHHGGLVYGGPSGPA